jgi:hypothetical protein
VKSVCDLRFVASTLQLVVLMSATERNHKCNFWMRHHASLRKFEAVYKKLNMAFSLLECVGYELCRLWDTGWCNYERNFVALLRDWSVCFKRWNFGSFSWISSFVFQERILPLRATAVTFYRSSAGFRLLNIDCNARTFKPGRALNFWGFCCSRLVNNPAGFAFSGVHSVSQQLHVTTYSYSWHRV